MAYRSPVALLLAGTLALPLFAQPRIDRVVPSEGTIAGGTNVSVSGSGLSAATLRVDDRVIVPSSQSDGEVRFATPPHDNGYALLEFSAASGSAYAEFLYVPPKLESLPPGYITTIAGVGNYQRLHLPATSGAVRAMGIATDPAGNIYFAWSNTNRVYKIRPDGILEPFAGSGFPAIDPPNGDGGPAVDAGITFCRNVALDAAGNAYIPDASNRVRRVDATSGIITTIAGGGPLSGFEGYGHGAFCGDGGSALAACLNTPWSANVDSEGNLYVSDNANGRLRIVDASGIINSIGEEANYGRIVRDDNGSVLVSQANRIKRFLADGTSWNVAGIGQRTALGDGGPATQAGISIDPSGALAVDAEGNLFVMDTGHARIRAIRFGAVLAPPGGAISVAQGSSDAGVSRAVTAPFEAKVATAEGKPAPNVRVDFAAPPSAASCVFDGGARTASALTDRDGRARISCTATCTGGSFQLTAAPLVAAGQAAIAPVAFGVATSGSSPVPHVESVFRLRDGVTLQVRGTSFSPCSSVRWNGSELPTTFINTGELHAALRPENLRGRSGAQVAVATPAPGGGISNSVPFLSPPRRR